MKSERHLNIMLLVLLVGAIMILARHEDCIIGDREAAQPAELPHVEVRMDTVWVHDTVFVRLPSLMTEVVRTMPATVDTEAVLASYFAVRTYADTLRLRDVATVYIADTVTENRLHGRQMSYDLAMMQPRIIYDPPDKEGTDFNPRKGTSTARMALSVGVQLGSEQAAVLGGVRWKCTELGVGYDMRLHAPSILIKHDIGLWQ